MDRCNDNGDKMMVRRDLWNIVKCKNRSTKITLVKGRLEEFRLCVRNSFFSVEVDCGNDKAANVTRP